MRRAAALSLLAAAAVAASQAHAQSAQRPSASGPEIVVRAKPPVPPAVVSTFPAQGADVASGTLILTVRFNQDMTPDGWSYAKAPGVDFPACLPKPRLLADGRTFVLLCSTVSGRAYAVGLNASPPDGFADPFHRFAPRFDLRFTTAATGEPVRPVEDALKAAGLQPSDSPIMTWQGQAGAPDVSQTAPPDGG
ncbi:MAG: hypothetical protein INR64_07145 [Caulobacteraceae bacterium]|nr:hypothetical protein [Caulobacter sp.]